MSQCNSSQANNLRLPLLLNKQPAEMERDDIVNKKFAARLNTKQKRKEREIRKFSRDQT